MSFRFSVIVELLIFVTCEKGGAQAVHEPHFSRWFFKGQYSLPAWPWPSISQERPTRVKFPHLRLTTSPACLAQQATCSHRILLLGGDIALQSSKWRQHLRGWRPETALAPWEIQAPQPSNDTSSRPAVPRTSSPILP